MTINDEIWDIVSKDPIVRLLKRFFYHSIECLRELGGDQYYDLLKPIYTPSSIAASHLAREALLIDGSDLVSNSRIVSFGHDYYAYGNQPLELFERATVKRTSRCIIGDGPVEACVHCRLAGVIECASNNPRHQMVVTATIPEGYRTCEYYIKEVDRQIDGPKDYGKKITDLPLNPLNAEQRLQLTREALAWYTSFNLMAIEEKFGNENFLNNMRYRMWFEGLKLRTEREKEQGGEDIQLSDLIVDVQKILGMRSELSNQGDALEFKIISCPFAGLHASWCSVLEMFFEGLCKCHGECKEFIQLEKMTEGAPSCRYVLRPISDKQGKWTDGC